MKKLFLIAVLAVSSACGYSSKDNEAMGQVKKVMHNTPIFCPNYYDADVSLGVMRNGVGSMSTQDMWVVIDDPSLVAVFKQAVESGAVVKVTYDIQRVAFCTDERKATKLEILP